MCSMLCSRQIVAAGPPPAQSVFFSPQYGRWLEISGDNNKAVFLLLLMMMMMWMWMDSSKNSSETIEIYTVLFKRACLMTLF